MATPQDIVSETGRRVAIGRQTGRQYQTPKGIVKVGTDKGWLRLRWTYLGKRYALTLGLPDSDANRRFAQQKAHQIELDIISGHFDPSLKLYKSETAPKRSQLSVVNLFRLFTEEKAKGVYIRTLEKYQATSNYLAEYFKDKPAHLVDTFMAEQFVNWLGDRNGGRVLKERIGLLNALLSSTTALVSLPVRVTLQLTIASATPGESWMRNPGCTITGPGTMTQSSLS